MSNIPTKRLLVYLVCGVVVLVVGTIAIISMRSGSPTDEAVTIAAGGGSRAGDVVIGEEGVGLPEGKGGPAGSPVVGSSSASSTDPPTIFVQVAGAVRHPGVYKVSPEERVFQAIDRAGGFSDDADRQSLSLAAELSDGCRVYVPRTGEVAPGASVTPEPQPASAGQAGSTPGGAVSLNSAGLAELDALPGIGPAIAQDIITYREAKGPFTSIDQLMDVPGIGPSKLEQLRPLVAL